MELKLTRKQGVNSSYPSNAQTWIGDISYSSSYNYNWDGLLDEIRIYSSVLDQNDITSLYNLSGEPTTNLVAYYPLNGNSNDTSGGYTTYNGADTSITYVQSTKRVERIDSGALLYLMEVAVKFQFQEVILI